jgi:hypothetical protein
MAGLSRHHPFESPGSDGARESPSTICHAAQSVRKTRVEKRRLVGAYYKNLLQILFEDPKDEEPRNARKSALYVGIQRIQQALAFPTGFEPVSPP